MLWIRLIIRQDSMSIIFSGDADFIPVFQRAREHDRRTMVVSSSQTAEAYENAVDTFLQEQDLIELIRPEEAEETAIADSTISAETSTATVSGGADAQSQVNLSDEEIELRQKAIETH